MVNEVDLVLVILPDQWYKYTRTNAEILGTCGQLLMETANSV